MADRVCTDLPRILLVGNYEPDGQRSMLGFLRMMESALRAAGYDVDVIRPARVLLPAGTRPQGPWKWVGYIDKFILFPARLRRASRRCDVVHICDHSNAIYARHSVRPTVVTCHDVIAIQAARSSIAEWRVGWAGRVLQRMIFRGLQNATCVVCVSDHTKAHLSELGWTGSNISVAPNSLNADFRRLSQPETDSVIAELGLTRDSRYLLHVGGDHPRKNRAFLLQLMVEASRLDPHSDWRLVLVGPPLSTAMDQYAQANGLSARIHFTEKVGHHELCALYSAASALIFPSLHEGFGWPVLEAQACGCPVFASNRAPMTEVGGSAARYFRPEDPRQAAKLLLDSLIDLDQMRLAGFENVERFSASRMVSAYASAYTDACKGGTT